MGWTAWRDVDALDREDKHSACYPGIYQIRRANRSGLPIPVARILRKDPEGILYIGSAARMENEDSPMCSVASLGVPTRNGSFRWIYLQPKPSTPWPAPAPVQNPEGTAHEGICS
jgi:hypothetical protein